MQQPQKLNIIALISGGKDSLYSILHCLRNGHEVVALGNLYPSGTLKERAPRNEGQEQEAEEDSDEGDDLDSFMYQTIGHSIIPLYEEALSIPLYREEIKGRAVNVEREYDHHLHLHPRDNLNTPEEIDETESLFYLLQRIKQLHPTANAVSAGAILSTYQRTRIENVAGRLGLIPIAWLWMYPYLPPPVERADDPSSDITGLLDDMAAVGCEARIVKVASAGLESADVLWGDLAGKDGRVRRTLVRTMGRFLTEGVEAAVLGEGGEYESLALNGPGFLWKKRIAVGETRAVTGEGGVASLRIKGARCVEKDDEEQQMKPSCIRRPSQLDPEFHALMIGTLERWKAVLESPQKDELTEEQYVDVPRPTNDGQKVWSPRMVQSRGDNAWYISNCSAAERGSHVASQMEGIVGKLRTILQNESSASGDDIVFTTILLRSMCDFAAINVVYASLFKKPNPPARVTVACGSTLPPGVQVMVSVVVDEGSRSYRHGLHVQSRSYWAPANIGPYSQAVSVPLKKNGSRENGEGVVYVAGQIPLDPVTMDLPEQHGSASFIFGAVLSLQHLWRIGRAMEVDWWLGAVAFLTGNDEISSKTRIVAEIWTAMNAKSNAEDEEEQADSALDPWDIKYGRQYDAGKNTKIKRRPLPNFGVLDTTCTSTMSSPPFLAVQVDELPRGADIEWQGLGTRSTNVSITYEDRGNIWIARSQGSGFGTLMYIGVRASLNEDSETAVRNALQLAEEKQPPGCKQIHPVIYTSCHIQNELGQIVPCRSVRGSDGMELIAGIVIHARP
ncbi:hypothetical protein VTO42DRAFT_1304 [Malbranchea cinnamomea]